MNTYFVQKFINIYFGHELTGMCFVQKFIDISIFYSCVNKLFFSGVHEHLFCSEVHEHLFCSRVHKHLFCSGVQKDLFFQEFMNRVCGVFLTDSVHYGLTGKNVLDTKLRNISRNYVANSKPVGKIVYRSKTDLLALSAGHEKHEWTSWSAMLNIFQDIRDIFSEPQLQILPTKDETEL